MMVAAVVCNNVIEVVRMGVDYGHRNGGCRWSSEWLKLWSTVVKVVIEVLVVNNCQSDS